MNATTPQTRSVVVEREIGHPPEKIWRALTQPHLIQEWLMKTDFRPEPKHRFQFSGEWGAVDCEVVTIEPHKRLAYTWAAFGLDSTVTWTLTPTSRGTHLRMEQAGFKTDPQQQQFYMGARASWPAYFDSLEDLLATLD